MTTSLHAHISDLAARFAADVLSAIKGASLDDILTETGGAARRGPGRPRAAAPKGTSSLSAAPRKSKGRLHRRSPEEIAKALQLVVLLVKASKDGLRAEDIRKKLGLERKELPRVLKEGLTKKLLKSKGKKRSTTYMTA